MRKTCNGKRQLTKHRKGSEQCQHVYWGEQNQAKPCVNQDFGLLFETEKDLEYHLRYHCRNHENPFGNLTRTGHIDRRTLRGYGIHHADIQLLHNKILFGRRTMTWNCMECNYQRDTYEWKQVYGHVMATHCYTSSKPNGRWNIPTDEQYKDPIKNQLPSNCNPAGKFELLIEQIHYNEDEAEKKDMRNMRGKYNERGNIICHLGKHPETTTTGPTICPYCPFTFKNIAKLKIHIRNGRCSNMKEKITPKIWDDIKQANPNALDHQQPNNIQPNQPKRRPEIPHISFYQMDLMIGRIQEVEDSDPKQWQCVTCGRKKTQPRCNQKPHVVYSLRNN